MHPSIHPPIHPSTCNFSYPSDAHALCCHCTITAIWLFVFECTGDRNSAFAVYLPHFCHTLSRWLIVGPSLNCNRCGVISVFCGSHTVHTHTSHTTSGQRRTCTISVRQLTYRSLSVVAHHCQAARSAEEIAYQPCGPCGPCDEVWQTVGARCCCAPGVRWSQAFFFATVQSQLQPTALNMPCSIFQQ